MFWIFFEFPTSSTSSQIGDYKNLIDVAMMTLLGLGLSMSCIKNAQYHTIGMTILLAALSFQFSIIAQGFWSKIMEYATLKDAKNETVFNTVIYLDMKWLVHGFYGAFAVLISTSCVIGKTSPVQLILMAFSEVFIYSVNYFCIILVLGAIDYGGSMFIHVFGACYGLAASWSLYKPSVFQSKVFENHHSKASDMIAIIGTVLLWVLMPSFNAALISNAQYQYRAQMTTFIAMAASCVIHFVVMRLMRGRFSMRDLQRGAIVGGISMASVQSVIVSPGGALTIGLVAGALTGLGLCVLQPLIKHLRIYDTSNVFSTHLLIGVYGGLVSIVATGNAIDNAAKVKIYGDDTKTMFGSKYTNLWGFQICALCITVVTSIAGGFLHGFVYNKWLFVMSSEKTFEDSAYWIVPTEPKNKDVNNSVVNSGDQELMVQCTVCSTIEDKLRYSHQELKKQITEKFSELEKKNLTDLSLAKDQNEKQVKELKEKVKHLEDQIQNLINSLNNSQLELAKKEEEERKRRELEEKMRREQEEKKRQEEEARRKKDEEDRKKKEEEDRLRKAQLEEDERKRKAQLEEDERKRKAQLEEDERKRKAQLEEDERKRKAQIEEEERRRKAEWEEEERRRAKEEEEKKNAELSQMSKVMQDLLSKSTATEDESGTRYQSFEGINVDYNVLSVFDMLRGEELLGFDDSMDNLDMDVDDGDTDLSEYEKLHNHSQKKSSYIVLYYKDGKINNKMLFYKKGLRFKEFMPELTDDSMFHIIFRVRCKESGGITLFKYIVATYAGDNIKAMHKGILTGNGNTLGKFFGIISYQVLEREKIKEEVIEKMKSSATGNVQKMTFVVQ